MTKNIEWLKEEIGELPCVDTVFISDGLSYMDSAVPVMTVYDLINELDEPEVLTSDWIDKNVEYAYFDMLDGSGRLSSATAIIKPEKLTKLLVPKQEEPTQEQVQKYLSEHGIEVVEKPVIPKFVVEFLIGKEDYMLHELFDGEWLYEEHDRVAKWLYDNDELTNKQREIDLVMARDRGYLVEEEQKYYVLDKTRNTAILVRMFDEPTLDPAPITEISEVDQFTEQEIKDYDPRYMAFAKPVEELEE